MSNATYSAEVDQVDPHSRFGNFARLAWRQRRPIAIIVLMFQIAALLVYSVTPPVYVATMTLAPPLGLEGKPSNMGTDLGTLAEGLTGISAKSAGSATPYQMFEVLLTSRRLAGILEQNYHILGRLNPGLWDAKSQRWRQPTGLLGGIKRFILRRQWQPPDSADLAGFIKQRLSIREIARTPIREISFSYSDPKFTAWFLETLVKSADQTVRDTIAVQTEANLTFLRSQLAQSTITSEVRNSLAELTTAQLQILVQLRNPEGFAVQALDGPYIPRRPIGPNLVGMCIFAFLLSTLAAALYILLRAFDYRRFVRDLTT